MKRIKETALLFLGLGFVVFVFYFSGIGPFVAWNIIIKNTNALAHAYNTYNGLN